ncbi:MAG: AraC family transcriptional regulator [Gemmiger sp.]|uniref:AraC family transcriptional regulator n=1 Tax=Gemmiger sp. TaxID=2049027 RepID=UPI002E78E4CC|nr:AraC family transcriptional regulator [Gemmiger sp.]MEE0800524.1 AraC family transcriptional regulator [Gemmiger sp.]
MSCTRYDITMGAAPREAIRLLYISTSRFGGDWHSVPHTHSCTELFYCLRGKGQFSIEGGMYDVNPDDLIIVNPMVEHTELSLNSNPLEYIVLGIEGVEFLCDQKNRGYARLSCRERRDDVLYLLQLLLREVDEYAEGYETVCQDLLEVLLLLLVRNTTTLAVRAAAPPKAAGSKECAAAKRYLDENFTENITLDRLAQATHISKYYLVHAFQKEYHTSPINYLLKRRILESKALLASTNYSLSEISNMMGFSSASYFSQSFRRFEGMSPTEYRKAAQSS